MPKIRLPEFHGQMTEFKTFWDTFAATIDSQPFSKIEKLAYLKGLLKGEAAEAVSGYPMTEESYDVIVDVLHERYGNEELIVHMLYSELDDTPRAGSGVKETRQVYERLEKAIRMLEAYGQNVDQRHIGIVYESCMPSWVITKIHEKKGNRDDWSVRQLRQVVGDAIRFKELVAFMESDNHRSGRQQSVHRQGSLRQSECEGNSQQEGFLRQGSGGYTFTCVYCNGGHYSDHCQAVESVADRKRLLSAERRCFLCTHQGHKISNCSGKLCRCGGWHHRSICPEISSAGARGPCNTGAGYLDRGWQGRTERAEAKAAWANEEEFSNDDRSDDKVRSGYEYRSDERRVVAALKVTTCASGSYERKATAGIAVLTDRQAKEVAESFLMTAEAPVSNPDSEKITTAAIFFDPGSDLTLVQVSLVEKLELKPVREAQMAIDTVNSEGGGLVHGFVYEVKVHQNDSRTRTVEAFGVKSLIGRVKRLKASSVSEASEEDVGPEILVGIQHFWGFVRSVKSAEQGLTMVESTVGPILCGCRLGTAASAVIGPNEGVALERASKEVCKVWQAEGIGVTKCPLNETSGLLRSVNAKWEPERDTLKFGARACMAGVGVAWLSERSKKAVWQPLGSTSPVPEAQSLGSLPWSDGQWSPSLAGSVADCFDATAMTQAPCSAVDDDKLLRRSKAATSADAMFPFGPRDAKKP